MLSLKCFLLKLREKVKQNIAELTNALNYFPLSYSKSQRDRLNMLT